MGKIVSRKAPLKSPQIKTIQKEEVKIYIYSGSGDEVGLSPEEMDHVKRVFENIRKNLDLIAGI